MTGIMTSPYFSECVQNSAFQVVSEGTLKAVGRPLFTLADKNAKPDERKYAAMRAFVFQALSMVLYGATVTTIVKKGGYKMLRKMPVYKDMDACKANKNLKSFNKAFAENSAKKMPTDAQKKAEFLKKNRELALVKGAMEQIVMIGSGIILTILCPLLVTKVTHPIMKGFEKITNKNNEKTQTPSLDKTC